MAIFRYRVTIPCSKVFFREYGLDSGMSLFRLRGFLDRDLGFAPDQMTMFEVLSGKGKVMRRIGLFDFGDGSMDHVSVEEAFGEEGVVLRYVYNMDRDLFLELRQVSALEYSPRISYPVLLAERGRNPDQFSAVYEEFEEFSAKAQESAETEDAAYEDDELPEGEENL
ncbi:MAG TPA: hypothetical protein IAC03_06065 [Candidatus Coprenecus pullistercoris]|nr:hypothetical protein [Candidatus Coprenecus pullistercoris]